MQIDHVHSIDSPVFVPIKKDKPKIRPYTLIKEKKQKTGDILILPYSTKEWIS